MIDAEKIESLNAFLNDAHCISIVTHPNPDGDAIGSSLGMYHFLTALGKEVYPIVPNTFPDFLAWMDGSSKCLNYESQHDEVVDALKRSDLIFCLDFNTISRLNALAQEFEELTAPRILIDHHLSPDDDFALQFSDLTVSSTSELVYLVINEMGLKSKLTSSAVSALYAGILTDTGSFSYACSNPRTFEVAAELMKLGIDNDFIHQSIYNVFSENRMRLLGYCLGDKMVVLHEYKTAYIALTLKELNRFHYRSGDTEGIVNMPLSIKDVNVSVLFTEQTDGSVKMSLRSQGNFSVNDFARKYFYGGGHRNAAGGRVAMKMPELLKYFEICVRDNADKIIKSI